MKTEKFTVPMLQRRITNCMNQEKRALSLGDWTEAEWCRTAAREYLRRLEVAKEKGYWEHEYEALDHPSETLIGGSLDPVVGRTVEELETDCRIWEQNARGVLAKLKDEQAKNRNLMKLIWAIVLKHGGETRLNDFERGILRDDWELLEYTDMETLELVIKARSAPNDKISHSAGNTATAAERTQ